MQYRANPAEEWSNTFMFTGASPADATAWRALLDALNTAERTQLSTNVQIIRAYGYNKVPVKGDSADWSVDLRVAPNTPVTGQLAGTNFFPGDAAAWIRWGTNRMVKGKRVYLRKYYHSQISPGGTPNDTVSPSWQTPALAFAAKLDDGTFLDGRKITDKLGSGIVNHGVSTYITTRTLKKRPKRPPTSP